MTIPVVIIGAGPAGLTAAYELQRISDQYKPLVYEASNMVGGISRTASHNGYRFDIDGHRFFTKVPEVEAMWTEVLGDDFITVARQSRIFYRGKFFDYPLKLWNALTNLGLYETMRIGLSYLKWKVRPYKDENNFEEWVINRFGGRLYMHFFRTYTEKVWGIAPTRIQADWAAQRIKNLSLPKAVWNAISGANDTTSLIEKFRYPRLGPGMMWEKTRDLVREQGGRCRWLRQIFEKPSNLLAGRAKCVFGILENLIIIPTHAQGSCIAKFTMGNRFSSPGQAAPNFSAKYRFDQNGTSSSRPAETTNLATTFFAPAFSNSMSSLSPSIPMI